MNQQILLIDYTGKIIRLMPKEVRTMGRQAQGVRLIKLDKDQQLAAIAVIHGSTEDEEKNAPQIEAEEVKK